MAEHLPQNGFFNNRTHFIPNNFEPHMSVLISHPTGNANVRAVLRGLRKAGLLARFHTTMAAPPGDWSRVLGPLRAAQLDQRRFPEVEWQDIRLHPKREVIRQWAKRLGPSWLVRHEAGWASVDAVYRGLDLAVAKDVYKNARDLRAVYAYEDGALETFRVAEKLGVSRLYDLPIAHWRVLHELLSEEAERLPEWATTLDGLKDSQCKHDCKDEELERAERVFVASSFTRQSLHGVIDADKIDLIGYGCLPPTSNPISRRPRGKPISLVFVGQLNQRKGLADLIACLSLLDVDYHITLVGALPSHIPASLSQLLKDPRCTWVGVVPHSEVFKIMAQSHLFVFPSIVEGFGMVITEAMRSGCPVLTTTNTAGPDILDHRKTGFVVPIRRPDILASYITRMAEDEEQRQEIATAAKAKAQEISWSNYEMKTLRVIHDLLELSA